MNESDDTSCFFKLKIRLKPKLIILYANELKHVLLTLSSPLDVHEECRRCKIMMGITVLILRIKRVLPPCLEWPFGGV